MYRSTHSLTLPLDGGEWSASCPSCFTPRERVPGTHWIGAWVGPRAILEKNFWPLPGIEPTTPIIQPTGCTQSHTLNFYFKLYHHHHNHWTSEVRTAPALLKAWYRNFCMIFKNLCMFVRLFSWKMEEKLKCALGTNLLSCLMYWKVPACCHLSLKFLM
jgi:hypothetical protein